MHLFAGNKAGKYVSAAYDVKVRVLGKVPTAFRTAPEHADIERLEHVPTDKSLQELGISDYYLTNEIDPSGKVKVIVNVRDSVDISGQGLSEISVSFGLIQGDFDCSNNELTSIAGFPSEVNGSVYFCGNKITSLEDLKIRTHRGGVLCGCGSQINRSALGIMLSEGIISADFDFTKPGAFSIINRYLGRPYDIFSCQSELIHADFEEFTQI